jgi:hypothetical protein
MDGKKEQAEKKRLKAEKIAKIVGAALFFVGAVLVVIFLIDFFDFIMSADENIGPPKLFWLPFIAFPTTFCGGVLLFTSKKRETAAFSAKKNSIVVNERGERMAFAKRKIVFGGFVCGRCGKKLDGGAAFCAACGAKIKDGGR